MINTSFQLVGTESNTVARIVNTRTSDMEFSPSSEYLAVASNCIKGGYISVVKTADFDKRESLLYSYFNPHLTKSTQGYFKVDSHSRFDLGTPHLVSVAHRIRNSAGSKIVSRIECV